MKLTPHIMVNDAAGFIDFCTKAFGAVENARMNEPNGKRIMHAHLKLGESEMMLCDEFPEMGGKSAKTLGANPVTLNLTVDDADKAAAAAVAAGAKITMPVSDQFWGDRYGQVWTRSATRGPSLNRKRSYPTKSSKAVECGCAPGVRGSAFRFAEQNHGDRRLADLHIDNLIVLAHRGDAGLKSAASGFQMLNTAGCGVPIDFMLSVVTFA